MTDAGQSLALVLLAACTVVQVLHNRTTRKHLETLGDWNRTLSKQISQLRDRNQP